MTVSATREDVHFIDLAAVWRSVQSVAPEHRLRAVLKCVGVESHDEEGYYVRRPVVGLVGVGGLPVRVAGDPVSVSLLGHTLTSVEDLRQAVWEMYGLSGAFSYLNTGNHQPTVLAERMWQSGHRSGLHAVFANIGVFGVSTAVETEMACQRDLVHLSRVTVARTRCQSNPPFVVRDAALMDSTKAIRSVALSAAPPERHDEYVNALFPVSKATCFMLSGSVKNLLKVCEHSKDEGKEEEYRELLGMIGRQLGSLIGKTQAL